MIEPTEIGDQGVARSFRRGDDRHRARSEGGSGTGAGCPDSTPVRRLDEARAARDLRLRWEPAGARRTRAERGPLPAASEQPSSPDRLGQSDQPDGRPQPEHPEPILVWRSWPAAERPAQALAVALALLAGALGLGAYGGDLFLGGVGLTILLLSLSAYFFPTRYRIDANGIEAASSFGVRRRNWTALRTYADDRRGVTVSPYRGRHWLETHRGIRLLYGPEVGRDAVVGALAIRLERDVTARSQR